MVVSAFTKKDSYGTSVQREVEQALTKAGKAFEVIAGRDERQAYGDIRLTNAAVPTYLEVKGNRNYDDHRRWYNCYFEVFEAYEAHYSNNRQKARTLELVGVLNQANFDAEVRTIFVHKLGSLDAYLVYSPARILAYFNSDLTRETTWRLDVKQSRDADGQEGKFKLGVRIKCMQPEKLKDFQRSQLSKYATLTKQSNLTRAIKREYERFEQADEPTTEFRRLMKSFYGDRTLKEKDWWFYPVSLRKQGPASSQAA